MLPRISLEHITKNLKIAKRPNARQTSSLPNGLMLSFERTTFLGSLAPNHSTSPACVYQMLLNQIRCSVHARILSSKPAGATSGAPARKMAASSLSPGTTTSHSYSYSFSYSYSLPPTPTPTPTTPNPPCLPLSAPRPCPSSFSTQKPL